MSPHRKARVPAANYLASVVAVALMSGLIAVVPGADHTANVSLLYLLVVMGAAHWWGRGPAIFASLLAVLSFDWFFVEPRHTFTVTHPAEWLALGVFLLTAIVISQLTATLHRHAEEARQSERQTAALARASLAVASQVSHYEALSEVLRRLAEVVECDAAAIIGRTPSGGPEVIGSYARTSASALPADFWHRHGGVAVQRVWEEGRALGWQGVQSGGAVYLPLTLEERVLGVLYMRLRPRQTVSEEERLVVESLANLAAVSLERHRLTHAEAQTQALAEADRLKTALLSMVSHDFRSPLASIKTSVTGLLQDGLPWDASAQQELLSGIDQETDRLNRMVGNILALSRLEAGAWSPQCEVVPLVEVVGAALDSFSADDNRRINVDLAKAPSEVILDTVQMVQVLHNLLENALKYSPPHSPVGLRATRLENRLVIEVSDTGAGLKAGEAEHIFERFYRAPQWRESSLPGTGIGLAVCSGLVEAHGGQLVAFNGEAGGAVFRLSLPLDAKETLDAAAEESSL